MDNLEAYTIPDSKILLKTRGLSVTHKSKKELVQRLREALNNDTSESEEDEVFEIPNNDENLNNSKNDDNNENSNNSNHDDNDENLNNSNNENDENNLDGTSNGGGNTNDESNNEKDGNEKHPDNDGSDNNGNDGPDDNEMTTISFKDVEEALEKFHGASYEDIEQWITDFDETAVTCKWSDGQKYIFAKRLLADEAKGCVISPKNKLVIKDYATLTTFLKKEYKDEASHIEIHEELLQRKKKPTESAVCYMYAITKMANGKFDGNH